MTKNSLCIDVYTSMMSMRESSCYVVGGKGSPLSGNHNF